MAALLLGAAVVLGQFVGMVVLHRIEVMRIEVMLGDPVFARDDE